MYIIAHMNSLMHRMNTCDQIGYIYSITTTGNRIYNIINLAVHKHLNKLFNYNKINDQHYIILAGKPFRAGHYSPTFLEKITFQFSYICSRKFLEG